MQRTDDPRRVRHLAAAALLTGLLPLAGCTLHAGHTIAPYGDTPAEAHALEDRAVAYCRQQRAGASPPYSFTTDGCSWWPDGTWAHCCVDHDVAYWCGGSFADRMAADRRLQECVGTASRSSVLAPVMRAGVFLGGGQLMPTTYRWGYGWPYPFAGP